MISQNIATFAQKIATVSAAFLVAGGVISAPVAQAQTSSAPDISKISSTSSIPNFTIPNFTVPQLPQLTPPSPQTPHQESNTQRAQNIIKYTNVKRAQHGLAPVSLSPELQTIAQQWSEQNMREDKLYHRPHYWTAYPSYIRPGGENILQAWSDYSDERLVQMWYDSPGHRANMLDPQAKTIGVGVAIAADGKLYAAQNYGR